jgi:hypothetical protein
MKKSLAIIVITCISFFQAQSQGTFSVSGRVIDAVNGSPMQFAQIALSNSTTGTVTNEDGQFFLNIPDSKLKDSLLVSYLGYETLKLAVAPLVGIPADLRMKPGAFNLKEVEVVSLTPQEVLRRAFNSIAGNYGEDSLLLTGFFRSQKFAGKVMAEYTEAVIEDMKTGYSTENNFKDVKEDSKGNDMTRLLKGRVVSDTLLVNSMGDFGKLAGCLGCIFFDPLQINYRSVFDEEVFHLYDLKMTEMEGPKGGKVYHIFYEQNSKDRKLYKGEIYIDAASYAVMKFTQKPSFMAYDKYEKGKNRKTYTINSKPGWVAEMPLLDRTVTYVKDGSGWHLGTVVEEQWITFTDPSNSQKLRMGYRKQLVVTEASRDTERLKGFKADKQTGTSVRWDQMAGKADEDFWRNYNYLPIEQSLKDAIGKIKSEIAK